jgi:AcrR family transcriptional regulator
VLTEDISSRLHVGKGTLYRYFGSKEDLYFAVIVHGLLGMREAISDVMARDLRFEAAIETLTRTVIGYFWERRDFFVLLHRHEPKLDPSERAEWQRDREAIVDLVAHRLRHELRRRGGPRLDPRLAVEMLFGMIRAVCMYRREADQIDDLVRQVTGTFLRGVLPPFAEATEDMPARKSRRRAPVPRVSARG